MRATCVTRVSNGQCAGYPAISGGREMTRSYLFVPGSRADRFEKALGAGADRVIIDLEDAVAAEEKAFARDALCAALTSGLSEPVLVRVNAADTPWFADDLTALAQVLAVHSDALAGVVIPKLEDAQTVVRVRAKLPLGADGEVVGLLETAVGVHGADLLAVSGVTRLAVGAIDLSVDLGADIDSPVLDATYARLVIASRVAGIAAPLGSPPVDIHEPEAIETAARRLCSMGIGGQLCIHPAQISPVHAGFAPTADQVNWARRILSSSGASVQVDGQMVDKPVRDRAERILAAADRSYT